MNSSSDPMKAKQLLADPQSEKVQLQERLISRGAANELHVSCSRAWLGYRRSLDFDTIPNNEGIGQDNAALRCDNRFLVGVVSDGVSRSFYGDLAATILMNALMERLWSRSQSPPDAETFEQWLTDIEAEIAQAVHAFSISDRVDESIRENNERNRTKTGSQAVVAAFVLDQAEGMLHAYQVGDPFLYAFIDPRRTDQEPSSQWEMVSDAPFEEKVFRLLSNPNGRVSSLGKSQHHLACASLKGVCGIAAHSDGLPPEWGASLTNLNHPDALKHSLKEWARKDDVSFVAALSPSLQTQLNGRKKSPPETPEPQPHTEETATNGQTGSDPDIDNGKGGIYKPNPARKRRVNIPAATAVLVLLLGGASAGIYLMHQAPSEVPAVVPPPDVQPKSSMPEKPAPTKQQPPPIDLTQQEGQIQALAKLGYEVNHQNFHKVVKQYQQNHGLPDTGEVRTQTRSKLVADLKGKGIDFQPLPSDKKTSSNNQKGGK